MAPYPFSPAEIVTIQNDSRHCQMSSGERNDFWLRSTAIWGPPRVSWSSTVTPSFPNRAGTLSTSHRWGSASTQKAPHSTPVLQVAHRVNLSSQVSMTHEALHHFDPRLAILSNSAGKESAWNARDFSSIPGLGRSPAEGIGYPLQYSCLENPHGPKSLVGYSPWGCKESDMTDWMTKHSTSHPARTIFQDCPHSGSPVWPHSRGHFSGSPPHSAWGLMSFFLLSLLSAPPPSSPSFPSPFPLPLCLSVCLSVCLFQACALPSVSLEVLLLGLQVSAHALRHSLPGSIWTPSAGFPRSDDLFAS